MMIELVAKVLHEDSNYGLFLGFDENVVPSAKVGNESVPSATAI